jgi:hypothetical protein
MRLTSKEFAMDVELVEITPETNQVALFRRVAELNFDYSNLVQLVLKDDRYLVFEYREEIELLHPWKLYDVIMNILYFSNEHLFIFIEEYQTKPIKEIKKQKLKKRKEDLVVSQIRELIDGYEPRKKYLIEKLKPDYRWDILAIILLQLSNMPYLQGRFYKELIDKIEILYNDNIEQEKKIHLVESYLDELKGVDEEYLRDNIYNLSYFAPQRRDFNGVVDFLLEEGKTLQKIKDNSFAISHFLYIIFLRLKYRFHLQKGVEREIDKTLFLISHNRPDEKVANRLIKLYDKLINQTPRDSIFDWFFG